MIKYAKVINEETGLCEVGTGTNSQFYISIGMKKKDVQQSDVDGQWYLASKCPMKSEAEKLEEAKNQKLLENVQKRDERLNAGVYYKNILFDSDVDQKTNLQFIAANLNDEETIVWNGKNNEPLECTKADIIAIGAEIAKLTMAVWGQGGLNLTYINAINSAQTMAELEVVNIEYPMEINVESGEENE